MSPSPNRYFLFTTSVAVQAGVMVTVQVLTPVPRAPSCTLAETTYSVPHTKVAQWNPHSPCTP